MRPFALIALLLVIPVVTALSAHPSAQQAPIDLYLTNGGALIVVTNASAVGATTVTFGDHDPVNVTLRAQTLVPYPDGFSGTVTLHTMIDGVAVTRERTYTNSQGTTRAQPTAPQLTSDTTGFSIWLLIAAALGVVLVISATLLLAHRTHHNTRRLERRQAALKTTPFTGTMDSRTPNRGTDERSGNAAKWSKQRFEAREDRDKHAFDQEFDQAFGR